MTQKKVEAPKIEPIWKVKEVVGVDIGTHSIKAVQLRKKGKLTQLVGYGKVSLPENYVIEGIISEPEKVAKLIEGMFENSSWGEFTAKRVVTSLSESKIFTRILTLPKIKEKELGEAISWEASQYLPMALTDLYLDWQVVGANEKESDKVDVIFAAAPKSIVDSFLQTFGMAKLEVVGVEPSLSAIARAMIPQREKNERILVIDLGAETTNIAIFDNIIRVTGSTPVGGKQILRDTSLAEIEAVEVKGRKTVKQESFKITGTTEASLLEIVKESKQMIRYYGEKIGKEEIVNKVFLCGGLASLPGLTNFFEQNLNIKTEIGNPWANISIYPIKPVPKLEAPSYTNAIGLALAGTSDE